MATAFKQIKNGAFSTVTGSAFNNTTTPLTFSVQTGDGAKFPQPGNGFWATVWDSATYPDPTNDPNMEVVLVTARSTDSLTATRGQNNTTNVAHTAATVKIQLLVEDQQFNDVQTAINNIETVNSTSETDYVTSGLVIPTSASLAATLSAGGVYVGGTYSAVSANAHTYATNTDTYVDVSNTGTVTYVTTTYQNATSPALTANSLRVGKVSIATSATTIVAANITQYAFDSLGNPICKRNPASPLIGYQNLTTLNQNITSTASATQVTGASCASIIPTGGRLIKVSAFNAAIITNTAGNAAYFSLWNGVVASGTQLQEWQHYFATNGVGGFFYVEAYAFVAAGTVTFNLGGRTSGTNTLNVATSATQPLQMKVEIAF